MDYKREKLIIIKNMELEIYMFQGQIQLFEKCAALRSILKN